YLTNTTGYFNDVERNIVMLNYTEEANYTHNNDLYRMEILWQWDLKTGILLNLSINFENLNKTYLSGYFEQYLDDTSIFMLTTGGGIPGSPLILTLFTIILTIGIIIKRFKNFGKILNDSRHCSGNSGINYLNMNNHNREAL
ncbi:MAG: hypothetical protein ACTSXF_08560, partial [Promethearchaeota archaeon]